MRLAIAIGGTDRGQSGLGTYVRALLPLLVARLEPLGGRLVAFGTQADLVPYAEQLRGTEQLVLPAACGAPGPSALFHLLGAGALARRSRADVLLLPAANRRLTARSAVPTVAVVHDLAPLRVAHKYDRLRTAYVRRVVTTALRSQSRLVAVSVSTRDELAQALGPRRPSIDVIPNGVDTARFFPGGDRAAVARAALSLDRPYVLYVSRLEHPGKNHLRLVRAFARSGLARTHALALAGPDWGAEAAIKAESGKLGLGAALRVLGRVDDALLPGLIEGADALTMVGLGEGFGLPALEALASGRPVLAARAGALPEVVGPLGVLCDPLDEDDMVRGLLRVTGDDQVRRRARDEGPVWTRSRSWEATADALVELCLHARRS